MDAIEARFEDMLSGKLFIATSDVYRTEVFQDEDSPTAKKIITLLEACPFFDIAPVSTAGYEFAKSLRRQCHEAKPKRNLKLADSLHIAAGSMMRAKEIWTRDEKLVNYYDDGLLSQTTVCLPYLEQLRLLY